MTDTIERLRSLRDAVPADRKAHFTFTREDDLAWLNFATAAYTALPALLADLTRLQALERRWEEAPVCIVGDECQLWGGPDSLDDYIGKSVRLVREE